MTDRMKHHTNSFFRFALFAAAISISIGFSGCGSSKPAQQEPGPHRYPLTGRVISVEKEKQQVVVDAGDIPGFMTAMTMGYSVKDPILLESISPEDRIKADVVVNDNDVWLENIVVVKKADRAKTPASNEAPPTETAPAKQ